MAELDMKNIRKVYVKHIHAVDDLNLHIQDREFIVFVGPSGCGKSTILRMVAGLEEITGGDLYMDGKRMNNIAPKDRDVAMVFQDYALYPHMNVYDNMAFGLKLRKLKKSDIKTRVRNTAEMLGLGDYLDRKPKALSGGQSQRVALGRAIVRNPKLFLMDEPLSNLDAKLRSQMRYDIQTLHQRLQTTTIYVTHDQTEAMTMATRLVVLKNGVIQQIGSPKEVYDYPENMFVGDFIGSPSMNFLYGTLHEGQFMIGSHSFTIPEEKVKALHEHNYPNQSIILGIRPEDIHDEPAFINASPDTSFSTTIDTAELLGAETCLYSRLNEQELTVRISSNSNRNTGDTIDLALDMTKVSFFDADTAKRIYV